MVKKIIIGVAITIFVIFLALLIAPFFFKAQIIEFASTEINKMVVAKVNFKDVKLSLIRSFPNLYIALDGLEVVGINDFENELLVSFDRFSVTVNIMKFVKNKEIVVNTILLDKAKINGIMLKDGKANWDIVLKSDSENSINEETVEITTEKAEPSSLPFAIGLKKFEIRDLQIKFTDEANDMKAEIQAFNYILSGDMTKDKVDLDMKLLIDGINFWMGGIRYANNVNVGFLSTVEADLANMSFCIKENKFNLNEIILKFDGSVTMQDKDIQVDMVFNTEHTDFKSLLTLVPAIYMNDFKSLKTGGTLALNGDIKGVFNENTMPSANISLVVDNAMFSYPDLPKSVEKINISLNAHYDGEVFNNTTIDLDNFSFEMANNPFSASFHAKTPESDLFVSAKFVGVIDLNSFSDIIPLKDTIIKGLFQCDFALAGNISTIEKGKYDAFQAAGSLSLKDFYFESPDFPQKVIITKTQLNLTPRRVGLDSFDAVIGKNDISISGQLENFIPFVFNDGIVKGKLAVNSNNIDINEFMGEPQEEKVETPTDTEESQLSVIEIPKNIDFTLTVNVKNMLFDNLSIANTSGAITVKDGRAMMQNLKMEMLTGSITLNGEYNTQDINTPFINFDMNIRQFDITTTISSFSILQTLLPEPENYEGKVSATMNLYAGLDEHLSPILDSVNSKGKLQTQNLVLRNNKLMGTVADLIKNERYRTPTLNYLDIGYEAKNGRLWINDPIVMNITPLKIELKGDQGFDMTMNYRVDATAPVSAVGAEATNVLSRIPGGSNVKEIKITGHIKGTVKKPDISLTVSDMVGSIADSVKEEIKEKVTEKVEEVKQQVNEEINKQIEQIMAEAQKQAGNVRENGKQAANKVRNEANAKADKLVRDAANKSAFEKKAAQTAADKIRNEGEANAKKIEQESENQAQTILKNAQKKADDLKRNG